eukprot:GABW01004881.1.p2 GENE.GABW01004881.1~~GABW01004881.1.p2  ORF type:complete len:55 (+),score=4.43 GABW01004881.1:63-227(+)
MLAEVPEASRKSRSDTAVPSPRLSAEPANALASTFVQVRLSAADVQVTLVFHES